MKSFFEKLLYGLIGVLSLAIIAAALGVGIVVAGSLAVVWELFQWIIYIVNSIAGKPVIKPYSILFGKNKLNYDRSKVQKTGFDSETTGKGSSN